MTDISDLGSNSESENVVTVASTKPHQPQNKPAKKTKAKRKKYRSRKARFTIALLRMIVLGYLAVLVGLTLMEARLVYPGAFFKDQPAREGGGDPGIQSVEYPTTEGAKLRGRLLERQDAEHIVLFFHGNGVKAKWMDRWLTQLSQEFNATVMVAEYRGFDDDITPTEKRVLADSLAARDFLCQRFGKEPKDLILYGQSLGGGCAVAVASLGGAKALILERTFDRMVNVAANKYWFVPVRMLMKNRFDSEPKLTAYRGPLVVTHGTTDRLIPIEHAKKLYAASPSAEKHWIEVDGMGHNDPLPLSTLQEMISKVNQSIETANLFGDG
jgi:fermentation-respiration switch protein FrsA (DUF1100 family)